MTLFFKSLTAPRSTTIYNYDTREHLKLSFTSVEMKKKAKKIFFNKQIKGKINITK